MRGNVVFLGNNEFTLKTLLKCDVRILAAVYEFGHDLPHTGICDTAVEQQGGEVLGIPKDDKASVLSVFQGREPIQLIVVSYFTILPNEVLAIPEIGIVNIHPSLLPEYKGAYPIQWALINGERRIGVSFAALDKGIDTGGTYKRAPIDVTDYDDALTLFEKVNEAVDVNLPEVISGVLSGTITARPQQEPGSYFPKLTPMIRYINFRKMTARDIHNLTRSQVKYGGSISTFNFKRLPFRRSEIVEENSCGDYPGTILNVDSDARGGKSLLVQCVMGTVRLLGRSEDMDGLVPGDLLGT